MKKNIKNSVLSLFMILIMLVVTTVYLSFAINIITKCVEPHFKETGLIVFITLTIFIAILMFLNYVIPVIYLKIVYKYFYKDVYNSIPLYKLWLGIIGLVINIYKLFINYYKINQGNDEFMKFIQKYIYKYIDSYNIIYAFVLAVSLLAVDYAKSKKDMKDKKIIEDASLYIYKTKRIEDKYLFGYRILTEATSKTKLKRKEK
ncbi:hypothetical protein [Staphylococcus epidermidis]|uniref:hypothetical protein n=1 Tax=Staphylococcus epidermidis TaxID=1282 RepID=UPI00119EB4A7|nr:hypothetical protein [Staphylococcus epidermidis]MCG1448843.1 hypothetical protein [Staphylococcus epidermidis]MDZ5123347.1 hypothetical protein [Staphylococcus epidermidis]